MSPWAWLKFTIFLWLLRKTIKLTGCLLLVAAVIAAWPVTVVAAAPRRDPAPDPWPSPSGLDDFFDPGDPR